MTSVDIERRMLTVLPDGYDATQMQPQQPTNTYVDYHGSSIGTSARPFLMPKNVAAGDSSKHNFASAKLDTLTYLKSIRIIQASIAGQIMNRIAAAFLREFRLTHQETVPIPEGAINNATWFWDGPAVADQYQQARANAIALESGAMSFADLYASQGADWRSAFTAQAQCLGITFEEYQQLRLRKLFPESAGTNEKAAPAKASSFTDLQRRASA